MSHTILDDLVNSALGNSRMAKKYREFMGDPVTRSTTEYFGRRSIRGSAGCIALAVIGVLCAAGFYFIFQTYHFDATVLFVFFGTLTLLLAAIIFEIYPYIYLIRVFRYAKFQCNLNDLPIGARAKRIAILALLLSLVLLVATAAIILLALQTL